MARVKVKGSIFIKKDIRAKKIYEYPMIKINECDKEIEKMFPKNKEITFSLNIPTSLIGLPKRKQTKSPVKRKDR